MHDLNTLSTWIDIQQRCGSRRAPRPLVFRWLPADETIRGVAARWILGARLNSPHPGQCGCKKEDHKTSVVTP